MSTLPALAEALCRAIATGDLDYGRTIAAQVADKLPEPRASRIRNSMRQMVPVALSSLKQWTPVVESRRPWVPDSVEVAIKRWVAEASHAEALLLAGERPMPLLLTGETRCGKTSTLACLAAEMNLPVMRMSIADAMGEYMGQTCQRMRDAFREIKRDRRCVWLVDELDGVASKRDAGGQAASRELNSAITVLLTEIETMPPGTLLVATSNVDENIDPAVRARFEVVSFPAWEAIDSSQRLSFARSHGAGEPEIGASYADTVQACRRARVDAILARTGEA